MPRKNKHPKDMTSDELIKHFFHPKIVKHVKEIVRKHNAEPKKKATTK
jgi:hypothetical protein